jgi:hypothetical protein
MATLRPRPPKRFRRAAAPRPIEELYARLDVLIATRQRLRLEGASAAALERNRIEIARTQWELSYALVDRYVAAAPAAA